MNPTGQADSGRTLTTADLARAGRPQPETVRGDGLADESSEARRRPRERDDERDAQRGAEHGAEPAAAEKLAPLFPPHTAEDYRGRWAAVQSGFVDDPRQAARQGDELVAQVMKNLAESFAQEREHLERQLNETGEASTEALRVAFRRYRSFFDRLLSL
jgi:hypothetical protein